MNPFVIWLSPTCDDCPRDREWAVEDVWGACEDCGAKSARYQLSPQPATITQAEQRACPGCDNPGCRHGGCQGRKPLGRLPAPQPERANRGTASNTDIAQPKADPHGESYREAIPSGTTR